jgi:hypothetical protein
MHTTPAGVVIFDTNAFRSLVDGPTRTRVLEAVRTIGRTPMVTEVNLIEVYPTRGTVGERLRDVVRDIEAVAGGALPWTYAVLKQAGEEFLLGRTQFTVRLVSFDLAMDAPNFNALAEGALAMASSVNQESKRVQDEVRPFVQRWLKQRNAKSLWPTLPEFLRYFWEPFDLRESLADQEWANLELSGPRPKDLLAKSSVFRIFNELNAVEVYQGAIAFEQPRQVQRMDLLQLPYLTAVSDSILVTGDAPFADAAKAVLVGRYAGAQVMSPQDLIALAA